MKRRVDGDFHHWDLPKPVAYVSTLGLLCHIPSCILYSLNRFRVNLVCLHQNSVSVASLLSIFCWSFSCCYFCRTSKVYAFA